METKSATPSLPRTSSVGRGRKRKALRVAFVVTTALGAAACGEVITNPPELVCPDAQPSAGSSCGEEQECTYIDDCNGGDNIATCEADGTWSIEYAGTCNPPPPDYPECPAEAPFEGDSCDLEIGSCSYSDECGQTFNATCDVDGWSVGEPIESCNPPAPCPDELPIEGDTCPDNGFGTPAGCSYEVGTACGLQTVAAECVASKAGDVLWDIEAPPCTPEVQDCSLYADSSLCDADTTCRWLVPGCGKGETGFAPACFPIDDCTADSCDPGSACTTLNHDPCWNSLCGACGADVNVCVELQE